MIIIARSLFLLAIITASATAAEASKKICFPDVCLSDDIDRLSSVAELENQKIIFYPNTAERLNTDIFQDITLTEKELLSNEPVFNSATRKVLNNLNHLCDYVQFALRYGDDPRTTVVLSTDTALSSPKFVVDSIYRTYRVGDEGQVKNLIAQFEALNGVVLTPMNNQAASNLWVEHPYIDRSFTSAHGIGGRLVWSSNNIIVTFETGAPLYRGLATFGVYAQPPQSVFDTRSVIRQKWCRSLPQKKL